MREQKIEKKKERGRREREKERRNTSRRSLSSDFGSGRERNIREKTKDNASTHCGAHCEDARDTP